MGSNAKVECVTCKVEMMQPDGFVCNECGKEYFCAYCCEEHESECGIEEED